MNLPPILGIASVAIRMSDLAIARNLYGKFMGFEELPVMKGKMELSKRCIFKVSDRQFIEIYSGLTSDQDQRLMYVALETSNVHAMWEFLKFRGISSIDQPRRNVDGNLLVEMVDPFGFIIQFIQYLPDSVQMRSFGKRLSKKRVSNRLLHAGCIVSDISKADLFYKELLGFSEIWRGGKDDLSLNWINMKVPNGTDYLEYILIDEKPDRKRLGIAQHPCFLVSDMQVAFETLKARSKQNDFLKDHVPNVGRNNRWNLNLFDPDGTRIEFMEPFITR
jgi:catechol 2,3-dioxygenase-like lactoylglutathione lyase family enzyme